MPDSVLMAFNLRPPGLSRLVSIYEGVPGGVNRLRATFTDRTNDTACVIHYRRQFLSL